MTTTRTLGWLLAATFLLSAVPADARTCRGGGNTTPAILYSVAHPGLGEWYLKGSQDFLDTVPPRKFWLGFIPFFGWPGYVQVRSAIDVSQCRVNDRIF
jgi:hypothetical protein